MITDQMKRRSSPELKDHFIVLQSDIKESQDVAKSFDEYEAVKRPTRKPWNPKTSQDKNSRKRKFMNKRAVKVKPTDNKGNYREKPENREKDQIFRNAQDQSLFCVFQH